MAPPVLPFVPSTSTLTLTSPVVYLLSSWSPNETTPKNTSDDSHPASFPFQCPRNAFDHLFYGFWVCPTNLP